MKTPCPTGWQERVQFLEAVVSLATAAWLFQVTLENCLVRATLGPSATGSGYGVARWPVRSARQPRSNF